MTEENKVVGAGGRARNSAPLGNQPGVADVYSEGSVQMIREETSAWEELQWAG